MQTRLRRSGSVGATARGETQRDANESLCHAIAAPTLLSVRFAPAAPLAPGTRYRLRIGRHVYNQQNYRCDGGWTVTFRVAPADPWVGIPVGSVGRDPHWIRG